MSEAGRICCYIAWQRLAPGASGFCRNQHAVSKIEMRQHPSHETATLETCAEFAGRHQRLIDERAEQFGKVALAIGCFGRDEVPTYADAVPRMVSAIESLKAKAAKWDEHEAEVKRRVDLVKGMIERRELKIRTAHGDLTICAEPEMALRYAAEQLSGCEKSNRLQNQYLVAETRRKSESGPGLRAQGGKYTEPGEPIIYCDNGNDE